MSLQRHGEADPPIPMHRANPPFRQVGCFDTAHEMSLAPWQVKYTQGAKIQRKNRLKKWLLRTGLSTVIIGRITCWWCGQDYLGKNVGGNGDISLPKSKETAISKTVYVVPDVFDLWKCIANKDSLFQGPNILHHMFVRDFFVDARSQKKMAVLLCL